MITPANFPKPRLVILDPLEPRPLPAIADRMARGEDALKTMKRVITAKVSPGLPVNRHRETLEVM